MTSASPLELRFAAGTIELRGAHAEESFPHATWDARSKCHRGPAFAYRHLVTELTRRSLTFDDRARAYENLTGRARAIREPRPYQAEALAAWMKHGKVGTVVLPTGAGKTHLAMMAIDEAKRSALVIAPTLDLVRQWVGLLEQTFGTKVGVVGGGEHTVLPLTVTTYDSAYLHMQHFGNRFGLIVFDECHHLPGETYSLSAKMSLAPFRLGLTATPERSDGREMELEELVGPFVYRKEIGELAGDFLSEYETVRISVQLSDDERAEYDAVRKTYLAFVRDERIDFSSPRGFADFIFRSTRSSRGEEAMKAYRRQREIAFATHAKMETVRSLLHQHRKERSILFTDDNQTAYRIARELLIPIITHQTSVRERVEILAKFSDGTYSAIVTSKVLNEGVDVPAASVAMVISGSGSVREHVQRLGRILRKKEGKQAVLYELVSQRTSEANTSERRREHHAYRRAR